MDVSDTPLHWYAFAVKPAHERQAVAQMSPLTDGLRLPVEVKHVKKHRRAHATRKIHVPLMAGYVFAGFRASLEAIAWRELAGLAAVRGVLTSAGGRPWELRADWAEQIDYSRVELPEGEARPLGFAAGDEITITEGAMRGRTGAVEAIDGERMRVIVEMFNTSVPAIVCVRQAVLAHRREGAFQKRSA